MPEKVSYDSDRALITVEVWGIDPIEDWHASRAEVMQLHKRHGVTRVFVDAREQETVPPVAEIFEFGETWPDALSMAILVGENTLDDVRLLETIGQNRSKRIRIFYEPAEALDWLGIPEKDE